MALRGKKPAVEEKRRLRVLLYGCAGSGKSTAAYQFPNPYIIDTEKCTSIPEFAELIKDGHVMETGCFDDMEMEVKELLKNNEGHKTLVIDCFSTLYTDLVDKCAQKKGDKFGRHWAEANSRIKNFMNLLFRIDMHIVIICHVKNEYGQDMSILGKTFDGFKNLDHVFDLCVEIQKRGDTDRVGLIKKSRLKDFPDGSTFPFSYQEIEKRYGKKTIGRKAVPEEIATDEQVQEIIDLILNLNIPQETVQKWLDKASVESLDLMKRDSIQKCIDHLKSKIQGE